MKTTVIVGYDQAPDSNHALTEAAREADLRGASLTVVHAYHWMTAVGSDGRTAEQARQACLKDAEETLDSAATAVRYRYPHMPVETRPVVDYAAHALAEAGRGADLLVVGARGRGGFPGLHLGSVSMRVLADTCCPVVVVRGDEQPAQSRITVALDVDEPSDDLLRFAFEESARRGANLLALHVWDEPWVQGYDRTVGTSTDIEEIKTDRTVRLESVIQSWHAKYPDVHAIEQVSTGSTGGLLVASAKDADLLVIGARRHGDGRHGLRIGPVADMVLHHSPCPVAVVPLG